MPSRSLPLESILWAAVTLIGWAFTAGMFYAQTQDLKERETRLEQKNEQITTWINAINVETARQETESKARKQAKN